MPMGKIAKRAQSNAKTTIEARRELSYYHGPVPSPEQLAAFDAAYPGTAERILKMTESQVSHRQYLEKVTVETQSSNSRWGLRFAFILGMTTILGGVCVASLGYSVTGFGTVLLGLSSLTGVFIYGKESNKKELIEKQKLMNQIENPTDNH